MDVKGRVQEPGRPSYEKAAQRSSARAPESRFPAVVQTVVSGLGRSKMPCVSTGLTSLPLRHSRDFLRQSTILHHLARRRTRAVKRRD